jgi:hypothetical protein
VDAALCSLNLCAPSDGEVVWDTVAAQAPFLASLRVMVQAVSVPQPDVRTMRCIATVLCSLAGTPPPGFRQAGAPRGVCVRVCVEKCECLRSLYRLTSVIACVPMDARLLLRVCSQLCSFCVWKGRMFGISPFVPFSPFLHSAHFRARTYVMCTNQKASLCRCTPRAS